jgi:hypothetical protein
MHSVVRDAFQSHRRREPSPPGQSPLKKRRREKYLVPTTDRRTTVPHPGISKGRAHIIYLYIKKSPSEVTVRRADEAYIRDAGRRSDAHGQIPISSPSHPMQHIPRSCMCKRYTSRGSRILGRVRVIVREGEGEREREREREKERARASERDLRRWLYYYVRDEEFSYEGG